MADARCVSHLILADDFLIVTKENRKSLIGVKNVLKVFEDFSACTQTLRRDPSTSRHLSIIRMSWDKYWASRPKFCRWSTIYELQTRGVLLVGRDLRITDYEVILDQMRSSLANSRTNHLSYGVRFQLAWWLLYGKLNCVFQNLRFPKGILDSMRKLIYSFVWDGRKGISWRQMTKIKDHRGIGLRDIKLMW